MLRFSIKLFVWWTFLISSHYYYSNRWLVWYHFICTRSDGILSYSMPQGDKRSTEWEFYDSTYDGYWDDELRRGLGQLTDGKVGPDHFRLAYYDTEKSIFSLHIYNYYCSILINLIKYKFQFLLLLRYYVKYKLIFHDFYWCSDRSYSSRYILSKHIKLGKMLNNISIKQLPSNSN